MTLTVGSLCTGYGGAELALTLAGWEHRLAFVADPDPGASRVLAHHHPGVPNLGDITRVDWSRLERVDVLAAGFPCQDVSSAGKRRGIAPGTRSGLWLHVRDAIDTLRPPLVLLENVRGLLSARAHSDVEPCPWCLGDEPDEPVLRALGAVLGDLSDCGYDAVWQGVPAAAVGAPHLRWRVFLLAWPSDCPPDARRLARRVGVGAAAADGVTLLPTPNAAAVGNRLDTQLSGDGRERPNKLGWAIGSLLPTPRTSDTQGIGEHGTGGLDLRTAVSLLPTPRARDGKGRDPNPRGVDLNEAVALLPTPNAAQGRGVGTPSRETAERRMYAEGRRFLDDAVALLPTPTAQAAKHASDDRGPRTLDDRNLWSVVTRADRWGEYAPAIARWEAVLGHPAPEPTEPGTKGQPRLSPAFVEWMQGLPAGHVTAVPGISRNDALRLLGNGIVPLQGAVAVTQLAAIVAHVTTEEPIPTTEGDPR